MKKMPKEKVHIITNKTIGIKDSGLQYFFVREHSPRYRCDPLNTDSVPQHKMNESMNEFTNCAHQIIED